MRAERDRTRVGFVDLGDQREADYFLVFYVPSGNPMVAPAMFAIAVDEVQTDKKLVYGYTIDADNTTTEVVCFPSDYAWYKVHQSFVEKVTVDQLYEAERANVSYRVQMEKSIGAVQAAAQGGDYVRDPEPTPKPMSEKDQLDWLDRQFPEEDPDDRKS